MAKFIVTIERKIVRKVIVFADNAKEARDTIEQYGLIEASSDYPSVADAD